jgi:hypothetical protein
MIKFIQIIVISLLILQGCSEEKEPEIPNYYNVFTGKTKKSWRVTGMKWTGDDKDDLTYSLGSCVRDDLYVFYANTERLYEVNAGSVKCSNDEPSQFVSDSWSFVNATSTLTIIFPLLSDNSLPFLMRKVTSKEMSMEIYFDQDKKYSYIITMQSVSEE